MLWLERIRLMLNNTDSLLNVEEPDSFRVSSVMYVFRPAKLEPSLCLLGD